MVYKITLNQYKCTKMKDWNDFCPRYNEEGRSALHNRVTLELFWKPRG